MLLLTHSLYSFVVVIPTTKSGNAANLKENQWNNPKALRKTGGKVYILSTDRGLDHKLLFCHFFFRRNRVFMAVSEIALLSFLQIRNMVFMEQFIAV